MQLLHIPFKDGGSGILKDVAGGDIHVTWFNVTNPVGMIKAGKVRPLAIAAPKRLEAMAGRADARRTRLHGLPAFAMVGGLRAVRRAARDHRMLHEAFVGGGKDAGDAGDLREGRHGRADGQNSVDDAAAWLKQEMETWRRDIADAGIKVDE